jgi:hypothetical protein
MPTVDPILRNMGGHGVGFHKVKENNIRKLNDKFCSTKITRAQYNDDLELWH